LLRREVIGDNVCQPAVSTCRYHEGEILMLSGFKKFLLRGNVVDMAVGIVIGAAFGTVVSSLVKDLLTPLIAAIIKAPDFSNLSFTFNNSKFLYGDFVNSIVSFVIIAAAVYFFVVLPINSLLAKFYPQQAAPATTRLCPECLSDIPVDAKRCKFCSQPVAVKA
jgi:large conductance mechanosensitive channel